MQRIARSGQPIAGLFFRLVCYNRLLTCTLIFNTPLFPPVPTARRVCDTPQHSPGAARAGGPEKTRVYAPCDQQNRFTLTTPQRSKKRPMEFITQQTQNLSLAGAAPRQQKKYGGQRGHQKNRRGGKANHNKQKQPGDNKENQRNGANARRRHRQHRGGGGQKRALAAAAAAGQPPPAAALLQACSKLAANM